MKLPFFLFLALASLYCSMVVGAKRGCASLLDLAGKPVITLGISKALAERLAKQGIATVLDAARAVPGDLQARGEISSLAIHELRLALGRVGLGFGETGSSVRLLLLRQLPPEKLLSLPITALPLSPSALDHLKSVRSVRALSQMSLDRLAGTNGKWVNHVAEVVDTLLALDIEIPDWDTCDIREEVEALLGLPPQDLEEVAELGPEPPIGTNPVWKILHRELAAADLACLRRLEFGDSPDLLRKNPYPLLACLGFTRYKRLCDKLRGEGHSLVSWQRLQGNPQSLARFQALLKLSLALRKSEPVASLGLCRVTERILRRKNPDTVQDVLGILESESSRMAQGAVEEIRYKLSVAGLWKTAK